MSLDAILSEISARLRQGRFTNEQAISQGVVLRVLQELGWDTWDTTLVWPEFQTGEGRADFALCHPASKPAVFIEVKQPLPVLAPKPTTHSGDILLLARESSILIT